MAPKYSPRHVATGGKIRPKHNTASHNSIRGLCPFFVLPISCCVLASPSALTVASSRPYPPPASSVWRNFPHQPASAASTRTKIRPSVNDKLIQKVMDIFIGCCKLFARGLGVAENAVRFFVLFLTLSHSLSLRISTW